MRRHLVVVKEDIHFAKTNQHNSELVMPPVEENDTPDSA